MGKQAETKIAEEILSLLRELWLENDSVSICGLINWAVDPSIENEIANASDEQLLQALKAIKFDRSNEKHSTRVTENHLAAMDEARDYDAASSYNWLNSELNKLQKTIESGNPIEIEMPKGNIVINNYAQFKKWKKKKYPHAD